MNSHEQRHQRTPYCYIHHNTGWSSSALTCVMINFYTHGQKYNSEELPTSFSYLRPDSLVISASISPLLSEIALHSTIFLMPMHTTWRLPLMINYKTDVLQNRVISFATQLAAVCCASWLLYAVLIARMTARTFLQSLTKEAG